MAGRILKICGLSTPETVDTAVQYGANWIGLVSFEPSPRHVEFDTASALADIARNKAKVVSLTVDADDALLNKIVSRVKPDILQFHGRETPDRIIHVKARFGLSVIKALGVRTSGDLEAMGLYKGVADYILLDAKPPKDATIPGGNGATFDWSILDALPNDMQFILSGGLTTENVADAILRTNPAGVDVSSGVESKAGTKEIDLIRRFLEAARHV